jgi:hypothetical protein
MMQLNQPSAGVPKRVILPYAGQIADIPTGWFLCNGLNGTPDLTDSFILGGTEAQVGQIGGSQAVTPAGSVNTGIAGSVSTGIAGSVSTGIAGSVSTGIAGSVSTGISGSVTVSNHTLTIAQMPSHFHQEGNGSTYGNNPRASGAVQSEYSYGGYNGFNYYTDATGGGGAHAHGAGHNLSASSSHNLSASSSHNISASSSHNISASSSHDISASSGFFGAEQDNRPKFYKAAYIMYVG